MYVQTNYVQPATIVDGRYQLLDSAAQANGSKVVPDAVEEIITATLNYGGNIVFLEGQNLDKFDGLALLTRY